MSESARLKQLETVVANMVEGIVIVDPSGQIVFTNKASSALHGFSSPDDMIQNQHRFKELFKTLDHDGSDLPYERWPFECALKGELVANCELSVLRTDTGKTWTAVYNATPAYDKHGKLTQITVTFADITERKNAEAQLRMRAEELETLMDLAPVAIWVSSDPQCRRIRGNRMANEFYQAQAGENVSAGPEPGEQVANRRFFHGGVELTAEQLPMQHAAAIGCDIRNSQLDVLLPSGKWLCMLGNASPLFDSAGNIRGCVGAFLDITEQKVAQDMLESKQIQLEEKNEELEQIISFISHDLRTPVINVKGFARELRRDCQSLQELISKFQVPPELKDKLSTYLKYIPESLGHIDASAQAMNNLLQAFVHYAKAGLSALQPENLDMNSLLREVLSTVEHTITSSNASISIADLPPCFADKTQVIQIFSNLIDNALKYRHPSRPLEISISGAVSEKDSVYVVQDNGVGIDAAFQQKIFEMFYRLAGQSASGEGIGLSIVKRMIDRNRGTICVESKPDSGSRFILTLPFPSPAR